MNPYNFLPAPYTQTVLPFEKNIAEHLKIIDITQARALKINIRFISIRCEPKQYSDLTKLYRDIIKWEYKKNVCRDKKQLYKRTDYGGIKGSLLYNAIFFSEFKTVIVTEDQILENIAFIRLRKDEKVEYRGNKDESFYSNTPSLLQIAYGLMKKHKNLELSIYGNIPGVIEPTIEEIETYGYWL